MSFLYFLEGLRNDVLDFLMLGVTRLGEEMIFIVVAMVLLWCIDKYNGYYMLTVGFLGTQINQLLKVVFRIERPWVRDPDFNPIEGAIEEATGYSFPSGHTQSSVGNFGSIARFTHKKWLRIACVVMCILVPLSRMYLGVHTPADVLVSFLIAAILIFAIYPIIQKGRTNPNVMRILFGVMVAWSVGQVLFMELFPFPAEAAGEELYSGLKNAYKMAGAVIGLPIVYELDLRCIKFPTKAVWWAQLLKVALGLVLTLAVKEMCYFVFGLFMPALLYRAFAYLFMVLFAGAVWPLTFKYFASFGNNK